jgi:hypothetical protein
LVSSSNKSEIIRKALQLFIAAIDGKRRGLGIGLFDRETKMIDTEIIGL